MTHFAVLVVGDNVEEQMAPYDENLEVDPYIEEGGDDDYTCIINALCWDNDPDNTHKTGFTRESTPQEILDDWSGSGHWVRDDRGRYVKYTTYNPKSKWDWYVVGGRWPGSLLHVDGYETDSLLLKDLDTRATVETARQEAEDSWRSYQNRCKDIAPPSMSWGKTLEKYGGDIDAARREWNSHPWIVANRMVWDAYEYYCVESENPKQVFIDKAIAQALYPWYAVVIEGKWFSRGDMGWFGMSKDNISKEEWYEQIEALLDHLPPDTLLTTLDCHI